MRLSKRGWNNVLIFGILLVIFIVNFQQELTSNSSTHHETVIANDLTILEVETPDFIITRVGRNWQSTPQIGLSNQQLTQIIYQWQHNPLQLTDSIKTSIATLSFKFFVAEQQQPIEITLHQQNNDDYIVEVNKERLLILPADKLTLFIGR